MGVCAGAVRRRGAAPRRGALHAAALDACAEVQERAVEWFEWRMPTDSLLDIALDQLTLARAELYRVLVSPTADGASGAAELGPRPFSGIARWCNVRNYASRNA